MDIKDVEDLARLARIELGEDEKKDILSDMKGILEYVRTIESMEVKDAQPEYSAYNVWREDKNELREFSKELVTKQFPDEKDEFLKVKKIL